MDTEITVPILPCSSISVMLTFYQALGFAVTYQQERPNIYACVKRGGIELHFFTLKGYDPAQSYSSCFVLIPDVDSLHKAFKEGLRAHYGKVPVTGIPRLTRPTNNNSDKNWRFNVIDPGGNWIRFGQRVNKTDETADENDQPAEKAPSTKLSRAILAADLLHNSKGDTPAAAKMLDAALDQVEPREAISVSQRIQALVLRAELAITMGEPGLGRKLLEDVRKIALDAEERNTLGDTLEQAEALQKMIE